jgi:hypothetical protein
VSQGKRTVLVVALLAAGLAGCGDTVEPSPEEKAFTKWLNVQVRWCNNHDPDSVSDSDVDLCVDVLDEALARSDGQLSDAHNGLVRAWQKGEGH